MKTSWRRGELRNRAVTANTVRIVEISLAMDTTLDNTRKKEDPWRSILWRWLWQFRQSRVRGVMAIAAVFLVMQLCFSSRYRQFLNSASAKGDAYCHNVPLPYRQQIYLDLEPWSQGGGITKELLETTVGMLRNRTTAKWGHMIHIRDNRVYSSFMSDSEKKDYTEISTRSSAMLRIFALATCFVELPDMDAVLSFNDGAIQWFTKDASKQPLPMFTFQKRKAEHGILIPYSTHHGFNAKHFSQTALDQHPWESKEEKLFWRGATTGAIYKHDRWKNQTRSQLMFACQNETIQDICDVGFYLYTQIDSEETEEEMKKAFGVKESMPLDEQMRFKYLVSMDGNGPSSGRTEKYFSGNSLIFKTDSDGIEFYYYGLHPYEHYIPIHANMSNLAEKLLWAREHDDQARSIVVNLQQFSRSLHYDAIACYLKGLLTEYAALLKYELLPLDQLEAAHIIETTASSSSRHLFEKDFNLECPA